MNKTHLLLILFLISSNCILISQNNDWQPIPKKENSGYQFLMKQDANIFYIMDSAINIIDRDSIISKSKGYIARNLGILQESEYDEPILITYFSDRSKLHKMTGKRTAAYSQLKNQDTPVSTIGCVYDIGHSAMNKELMGLILYQKWGMQNDNRLVWLKEGLTTYANPEADSCDGHNLEERYVYLLQNNKLSDIIQFPQEKEILQYKIACNQSAYIVEYLLKDYGVEKLKELWLSGMRNFELVYGMKFEDVILKINTRLYKKYPTLINLNWVGFNKDCINPQHNDWLSAYIPPHISNSQLERMVTKEFGNLKFTVDSTMSMPERNDVVRKTKEYIAQCLELINEQPFDDSVHLVLVPTRNDMKNLLGEPIGGVAGLKNEHNPENSIYCVYGEIYSPLGHEIMHIVSGLKWGNEIGLGLIWLSEGLSVYADPSTESCGGLSIEERYAYLLQNNMLLDIDTLIQFPDDKAQVKIAYTQSAVIVEFLLRSYGIEQLKQLWKSSMKDFEKVYGIQLKDMIQRIDTELTKKYTEPMDFNWNDLNQNCIE